MDASIIDMAEQKTLSIGLQLKDKNHLVKLQSAIGAGSISDVVHQGKYHSATYLVYSDKICEDLGAKFNIHPRKSLSLKPPLLKDDLARAFIAGYIDGDGSYTKTNNRPVISILGTKEMLEWVSNSLEIVKVPRPHKRVFEISFHGNDAICIRKSFKDLELPLLDRKKNRWEELGLNLSLLRCCRK